MGDLVQQGIGPVVKLPAGNPQVEAQPGRVGFSRHCPVSFVVAVLLTIVLPMGGVNGKTNCVKH